MSSLEGENAFVEILTSINCWGCLRTIYQMGFESASKMEEFKEYAKYLKTHCRDCMQPCSPVHREINALVCARSTQSPDFTPEYYIEWRSVIIMLNDG